MKLGATITSERGKPVTKTGNEYIDIDVRDDNRELLLNVRVYKKTDDTGEFTDIIIDWAEHVYINGEHGLDAEVTTRSNGNLKHGKCPMHGNSGCSDNCAGMSAI